MSFESNERRVKSLNDIAKVFERSDRKIDSGRSEISKFYLTNTAKHFEELDQRTIKVSARLISRITENGNINASNSSNDEDDYRTKERAEISTSLKANVTNRLEENFKVILKEVSLLLEAASLNFLDVLCGNRRKSTNNFKNGVKNQKQILSIIDAFLSMILIAPLTVGFWRGIWTLMDLHADWFPGVSIFIIGVLVHTSFAILKNFLHNRVARVSRKKSCWSNIPSKLAQILYTYVFGVACNLQWRGGWIIFDYFFGDHIWMTVGTMLAVLTSLAILRSVRNLIAVPSVVLVDKRAYIFWFPTRYKSVSFDAYQFILPAVKVVHP
ncbi:uncharacterized protein LOC143151828 [Ptiloglossa arizonensis]|uniref:uncharacterized protein LOC143151828 n=1 Tax=Ptiloglossa arizonensis TaxID=3350558 RepID=UPI003FA05976